MRGNTVEMKLLRGQMNRAAYPLYQYDYGQKLILTGVTLPFSYEVHFSNTENGNSKTSIGNSEGVDIPDEFLTSGETVYVWLFLHDGESDGETEYKGIINVNKRAKPTNIAPTPVQQDVITQTIAALDAAVEQTGQDVIDAKAAQDAAETAQGKAEDAQSAAETAQGKAEDAQRASEAARDAAVIAQGKAEDAMDAAAGSARDAATSAEDAYRDAERAEQAATTAGYLEIEMDEYGHLIYTRTDAVDVDFELNNNGHLVMEVI